MPISAPLIGICSIGAVPRMFEKIIAGHVTGFFGLAVRLLPGISLPRSALAGHRMQYDAAALLAALEKQPTPGCGKLIGVTAVDLCLPIFSHVFGEARQNGKAALVSTFRLSANSDGAAVDTTVAYERTAKVAIHEMGHLFNLVHCTDDRCLMHFSGSLADLDRIDLMFCRYCRTFLRDRIA